MEDLEDREIKGLISFPCGCKHSHVVVYEGTTGSTSTRCSLCGKPAIFHYNTMKAERIKPVKFGSLIHKTKYRYD